jgi:glycosyltransferase involved in cell wall biosynthesis
MRILFITTRLPHARVASGHVIVYERIRRLAQRGHEIGLAVFDDPSSADHAEEVRPLLREMEIVPRPAPHSHLRGALDIAFSSVPPYFYNFRSEEMMVRVGEMMERTGYHIAMAEFSAMGQYLFRNRRLSAVRKIISCHYSIATSYRKVADLMQYSARGIRSRLSLRGLLRYEVDMYRSVDKVLALTAQERFALQRYDPHLRVAVIPCGVDTKYFQPAKDGVEDCILFTGHFEAEPNRDAVMWFAHRVWPELKRKWPSLQFYVVGPGASPEIRDLMRRDKAIIVTGEVEDLRPFMRKAKVFICPVRLGSGLRVKILEAMAAGVPVVSTSLGAEGIPLHTGDNGVLADTPQMMAESILLLLQDDTLRGSIARQARSLVEDRFAWDRGIDMLEDVFAEVVAGR